MTDGLDELARLPDDLRRRIGAACQRFEEALQRGESVRAEDHLFDAGTEADVLLRELLLLECEYRSGPPATADELAARFPDHPQLVAGVVELTRRYASATPRQGGLTMPDGSPAVVGRFRLVRELGRGGFGVVFLAVEPLSGRQVAVKVPHAPILLSAELRSWFAREGLAAKALDHPHIVRVEGADEAGLVCFLVSEYVPGPSLAEWLREHAGPARPVP
ncbi:MAG: protein kinase, partial [Gemmataceae bacterium]|nr:protein kinase [Gemmataceae bacterium]